MNIPYDVFTEAFLGKVTEYSFIRLDVYDRNKIIDGYMKRAIAEFRHVCKYNLTDTADDNVREFIIKTSQDDPDGELQARMDAEIAEDLDEIIDIVSEGMLVQWMKPYFYRAENLENVLNTKDFSAYSPAELLYRITNAYNQSKRDFTNMVREYSYNHGDLGDLSL